MPLAKRRRNMSVGPKNFICMKENGLPERVDQPATWGAAGSLRLLSGQLGSGEEV
jgi:hypothetical protein